ncbi:MAG TPA: nuclear transport factor 2 family protein [Burkholderiaceae bacterium]
MTAAQQQVWDTEKAFAKTMADRNFAAFGGFLSDEAVFFGSSRVMRGKTEISSVWRAYYEKPAAPFSWEPAQVEVLESGKLALSTGPVHSPDGKLVGTFSSIWRQDAPGVWHIVFDKGNPACDCGGK